MPGPSLFRKEMFRGKYMPKVQSVGGFGTQLPAMCVGAPYWPQTHSPKGTLRKAVNLPGPERGQKGLPLFAVYLSQPPACMGWGSRLILGAGSLAESLKSAFDAKYIDVRDGIKKSGAGLGCQRTNRREPRNSDKNMRIYHGEKVSKGRRPVRIPSRPTLRLWTGYHPVRIR